MNNEEKLKKTLQDILSSKEFAFDEANWEKARDMIDASKNRKKRRFAGILFSGILFLGVFMGGMYYFSDKAGVVAENRLQRDSAEKKNAPVEAGNNVQKEREQAAHSRIKTKPLSQGLSETTAAIPEPAVRAKQQSVAANSVPGSTAKSEQLFYQKEIANSKEELVGKSEATVLSPEHININGEEKDTKQTEEKTEFVLQTPSQQAEGSKEVGAPFSEVPVNTEENNQKSNPETVKTAVTVENSSKEQFATDEPSKADINNRESVEKQLVDSNETLAEQKTKDLVLSDSTLGELLPEDNDRGELGRPKQDNQPLFSVEAGLNYMQGWQNQQGRDARGFNPLLGINVFNNVTSNISLSFGLYYSSVSHLSYSSYTSRVVRLSFGEESDVTVFTPVKLHYVAVPLRINYNLTAKNTIGAGCNIAYLINVENEIENYKVKQGLKYNQTYQRTRGYTEGFAKYDAQVSVFYKRTFCPKLAANIELFYGLTDIKENDFFGDGVFERNSGIKLTLVYNILKK